MNALIHLLVLAATVLVLARVLPGVHVQRKTTALVVALVFAVINFLLGWVVKVLLFVPVIISFGLLLPFVSLVTNAAMLWLTDMVVDKFEIKTTRSFWIAAVVITVTSWIAHVALRL